MIPSPSLGDDDLINSNPKICHLLATGQDSRKSRVLAEAQRAMNLGRKQITREENVLTSVLL